MLRIVLVYIIINCLVLTYFYSKLNTEPNL